MFIGGRSSSVFEGIGYNGFIVVVVWGEGDFICVLGEIEYRRFRGFFRRR